VCRAIGVLWLIRTYNLYVYINLTSIDDCSIWSSTCKIEWIVSCNNSDHIRSICIDYIGWNVRLTISYTKWILRRYLLNPTVPYWQYPRACSADHYLHKVYIQTIST
jgi:hypothetical protein